MNPTTLRRSFVGWVGPAPRPRLVPAGGTPAWSTHPPLWTIGDWRPHEVRIVADTTAVAAFLGSCLATDEEIRRAFRSAVAESRADIVQTLPGSYAVVLADRHGVQVLTDRAGLHPVFHTDFGRGTMYASDALLLAALHHHNLGDAVNPAALAAGLLLPDMPEPFGPASMFRRIERVGPTCAVTIRPEGHPTVRPLRRSTGTLGADEARTMLRDALVTAVDRRVQNAGNLSTDLSGGLDSSTVAVLAAQAGGVPVAITYADPRAVNDEDVHFARTIAATEPRLHHVVMIGDDTTLPFTTMDSAPITDEPSLDAVIVARTKHRLIPAQAHGSDVHLTGDGGDAVLTAPGLTYLADLARQRRRKQLRHEVTGWARLRQRDARGVRRAVERLAATSWPDTLRQLADQLGGPHSADPGRRELEAHLTWAALSPAAAWATAHAREELAIALRASPSDMAPLDSADEVAARTVRWHGAATRGFTQITRALGVAVQTPFLDGPVIDACLALPATERTTVGQAKPLLAAAIGDRMPIGLLDRRTKGDYSACEYYGLRVNAQQVRTLLADPLLADLDVLRRDGPRDALRLGLAGMPAPMGALGAVIATETWLRALDTLNPTHWWTPRAPQEEEQK